MVHCFLSSSSLDLVLLFHSYLKWNVFLQLPLLLCRMKVNTLASHFPSSHLWNDCMVFSVLRSKRYCLPIHATFLRCNRLKAHESSFLKEKNKLILYMYITLLVWNVGASELLFQRYNLWCHRASHPSFIGLSIISLAVALLGHIPSSQSVQLEG